MMYLVENDFIDKETKKRYKPGMVYITEDDNRFLELKNAGFLGVELAIKEEVKPDQQDEVDLSDIKVEDLTVTQLKELLDQMGIEYDPKAKKDELIGLIGSGE